MLYNLFENRDFVSVFAVALLAEGVDRNSLRLFGPKVVRLSPSSRRAWIEITTSMASPIPQAVALLAEGVDRNCYFTAGHDNLSVSPSSRRAWIEIGQKRNAAPNDGVALLAEGVDRNRYNESRKSIPWQVALLAEGVDRNLPVLLQDHTTGKSPSSRRAWIEIAHAS